MRFLKIAVFVCLNVACLFSLIGQETEKDRVERPAPPPPPPGLILHKMYLGYEAVAEVPNISRDELRKFGRRPFGRIENWLPFTVDMSNTGPSVQGELVLKERYSTGRDVFVYRKKLSLATGTRKRLTFPVLMASITPYDLTFENLSGSIIRIQNRVSWTLQPPKDVPISFPFVLLVTKTPDAYAHFYLQKNTREIKPQYEEDRFIVPVSPNELSRSPQLYMGLDCLILDDIPVNELDLSVQKAIASYVSHGGVLLVTARRHQEKTFNSELANIFPGKSDGVVNVKSMDVLEAITGMPCKLATPVAVQQFKLSEGATQMGEGPIILLSKPFNRGQVILAGFPLTSNFLKSWAGSEMFFQRILTGRQKPLIPMAWSFGRSDMRAELAKNLKNATDRPIPTYGEVFGSSMFYIFLVALLPYFIFKRLKRLEWAWALVILMSMVGSVLIYTVGQEYFIKENTAFRVGLVEGAQGKGALVRNNYWSLFTSKGGTLDLDFEDEETLPFFFGSHLRLRGQQINQGMTISYSGKRLRDFETHTQDTSLFQTVDSQQFDHPVKISRAPDGKYLLKYSSDLLLSEAWVLSGGKVASVTLKADQNIILPEASQSLNQALSGFNSKQDKLKKTVLQTLMRRGLLISAAKKVPVLMFSYEGRPALANKGIKEEGMDFGFVEISIRGPRNVAQRAGEIKWTFKRVTPRVNQNDDVECLMYAEVGDVTRLSEIRIVKRTGIQLISMFNNETGRWDRQRLNVAIDPLPYVKQGALGLSFVRIMYNTGRRRPNSPPSRVEAQLFAVWSSFVKGERR